MNTAELRTYFTDAALPDSLHPRPHMNIIDVSKFVDLHLARLESDSPIHRRIAERNLLALYRLLEPEKALSQFQPSTT